MERLKFKSKLPGYTLIEMLSAVAIIGLVLPVLFSVLINSYNNLSKIEKLQFSELQHQQFRGRINYDFDNIYRIYHLSSDSISFTAFRNNSFQDLIEYYLNADTLFFKINRSSKKIVYNDFIANGGWVNSKSNGKMRLEGKDYIVQDGDVLNFRFNT